jgi:hypothetical protein
MSVATLSRPKLCYRSPAGIAGSNAAGDTGVCLLQMLCIVQAEASATGWSRPGEFYRICIHERDQAQQYPSTPTTSRQKKPGKKNVFTK